VAELEPFFVCLAVVNRSWRLTSGSSIWMTFFSQVPLFSEQPRPLIGGVSATTGASCQQPGTVAGTENLKAKLICHIYQLIRIAMMIGPKNSFSDRVSPDRNLTRPTLKKTFFCFKGYLNDK
jgi:hypothetical protein